MAGLCGPLGTLTMDLSIEIDYCDDSNASTTPTTHSDGGDSSERVGITRTKVNDLQVAYSTWNSAKKWEFLTCFQVEYVELMWVSTKCASFNREAIILKSRYLRAEEELSFQKKIWQYTQARDHAFPRRPSPKFWAGRNQVSSASPPFVRRSRFTDNHQNP